MFDREEICDHRWKKVDQKGFVALGNEWKTRFENQEEINRHLARQIILLERNIEQAKEEQKMGKPNGPWPAWNEWHGNLSFSENPCSQGRSQRGMTTFFLLLFLKEKNIRCNFKVNQDALNTVENEKKNLLSQLRDYEWRLEQENKVIETNLFVGIGWDPSGSF